MTGLRGLATSARPALPLGRLPVDYSTEGAVPTPPVDDEIAPNPITTLPSPPGKSHGSGVSNLPSHDEFMRQALGLAARAIGCTSPNPLVGSLVVRDDVVVGEGWHKAAGSRHAEVEALASAGDAAKGATLYATLEPCSHHGRTPPCVDAILASGIARVVYAMADPNPAAAGGAEALRRAGVSVIEGVEEAAARELNRFFLHSIATRRPRVILKSACSLDGKVATRTGESRWITSPASRRRGHELRQAVDTILVGAGTVVADDPALDVRLDPIALATDDVRHPRPIVLDSRGRLPTSARLVRHARERGTLIATTSAMPASRRSELEDAGCEVRVFAGGDRADVERHARVALDALVQHLADDGVQSLLLEGGPAVTGAFLDAGLVDEVWCFIAPIIIGGVSATPAVKGTGVDRLVDAMRIERPKVERLDGDVLIRGETSARAQQGTIPSSLPTKPARLKERV